MTPKKQFLWEPGKTNFKSFKFLKTGLRIKKSSGRLLVTNWRNIVARCKFVVVSLYNVNYAAHSMVQSIRFHCLKISRTEVSINLEVNWICVCNLAHFLWRKQNKVRWTKKCLLNFNYFKSKSKRNLVAKVVTKPEFLVAKEKMLVTLATMLFIMYTAGGWGGGAEDTF